MKTVLIAVAVIAATETSALAACRGRTPPKQMIVDCTKAINSGRFNQKGIAIAHHNIGNAYLRLRRYNQALSNFQLAIKAYRSYYPGWSSAAYVHAKKRQHRQIVDLMTRAIRFRVGGSRPFAARATAYYAMKKYGKALADIRVALRRQPINVRYLFRRAEILRVTGNKTRAIRDYRWVIRYGKGNRRYGMHVDLSKMRLKRLGANP